MPKVFTSKNQKKGELGEDIACKYLVKQGFEIIERNFTKKYGEIDIVAQKDNAIYFVEVKAVARNFDFLDQNAIDQYRPEDNMHPMKLKRLSRVIQVYLLQKNIPEKMHWQVDLLCVFIDEVKRLARVKRVEDIIL